MKRIISAFLITLMLMMPSFADTGTPGLGWHVGGDVVTNDMPFITISNQTGMSNERALSTHASFPELVLNDKGANSALELQWSGQLPITRGGTGAATQQAAVNAILNFTSIASGDTIFYNGTNWVRLAKGSDGQVLTLASGLPSWSGSTTGAPDNATYLTLTTNGSLSNERTIAFGSGLSASDGGAGLAYTISPDLAVLADLSTSQSLSNKILVNPTLNDQVTVEKGARDVILTFAAPATSTRTINFPDPGANGDVVYTVSAQTITGIKTMTNPVFSDQFTFEKGAQDLVITAAAPATSSRTINFPDPGANGDVVYTVSAQTLGGIKTFTSQPVFPSAGVKVSTSGANSYTVAGTNPSADRSYNLYDAGGNHDIAIKSGTPTSGAVAYGDGNKILFSAGGSDGQWLKRVSGAPTWTTLPASFGGDSSDGSVTINGSTTYSGPVQKNTSSFTINSSKTLTCDTASPVIIQSASTIDINGTITCTAGSGGAGGSGYATTTGQQTTGMPGAGPGGGHSLYAQIPGGGGGGFGGTGGRGGGQTSGVRVGASGNTYWSWKGGGSGGAGGGSYNGGTGGTGGSGGMCLMLISVGALTVSSTGTITNSGSAGTNSSGSDGGGGGGGSGGAVWLISQTSVTCQASSVVTCSGANGGNGSGAGGGGGGGGGGRRIAWSPSNTLSGTTTVAAGNGGTSPSGQAGENASAGAGTSITGTPNLPLLTWIQTPHGAETIQGMELIAKATGAVSKELDVPQRALAAIYAKGDLNEYAKAMTPGFDAEATCINTAGDAKEALKNAA